MLFILLAPLSSFLVDSYSAGPRPGIPVWLHLFSTFAIAMALLTVFNDLRKSRIGPAVLRSALQAGA